MSFLLTSDLLDAANQVKTWNNTALSGMNQAKSAYTSLATQLEAMKTNPNYTADDCKAVEDMLVSIVDLAKSLINPEPEIVTIP
jgi:hypothetical protein